MYLLTTFAYKALNDRQLETIKNKIAKNQLNADKTIYSLKVNKPKYNNELAENSRRQIRHLKADYWAKETAKKQAERYAVTNVKTTNPLPNIKSKSKVLTHKKLIIGTGLLAATGLGIAGINKLRKSRKDKGKLRGKYNQ